MLILSLNCFEQAFEKNGSLEAVKQLVKEFNKSAVKDFLGKIIPMINQIHPKHTSQKGY